MRLLVPILLTLSLLACNRAAPPQQPPVTPPTQSVSLEATPQEGAAPLTVTFSATAATYTADYYWDFGDGSEQGYSVEDTITHAYSAPGLYTATVTVGSSEDMVQDTVAITVR